MVNATRPYSANMGALMTFTFRPAVRENTPLIIGLAGPSKSGKTYSAFRLATGMANGDVIAMINTEGARGHMYAGKFKYETVDLGEPFSYERYREAVLAARELKPAVLIIDSVSHAHEGAGGMLDQHEKYLDKHCGNDFKKRERNTWTAWIKPKAEETLFVNTMIQVDFPIILCFRAKEKLKIVRGAEPVPMGWQPICSDRIPFETTATLILPPGSKGAPDLSAQASELREPLDSMIRPDQINEELGALLQEWAKAGKKTVAPKEPVDEMTASKVPNPVETPSDATAPDAQPDALLVLARDWAEHGTEQYADWFANKITKKQRQHIGERRHKELKQIAAKVTV